MHAWIKLACVVLAWTILPAGVLTASPGRSAHPVQVSARTTNISSTSAHPAATSASAALTSVSAASPVTTALAATAAPARIYVVQVGDTLSAIAARFGVRGGWPALYAANRPAIGADPDAIHAGTRLTIPSPATSPASGSAPGTPAPSGTAPGHPQPHTQPTSPAPSPAPSSPPATGQSHPQPHASSGMPSWLKIMLLAVGLLAVLIFAVEPLLARRRRRRQRRRVTVPAPRPHQIGQAHQTGQASQAAPASPHQHNSVPEIAVMPVPSHEGRIEPARILMADHDRLIVTRSKKDNTICVLRPPGGDPADILRVARLVLPEAHYGKLAEQLGMSANWPMNQ